MQRRSFELVIVRRTRVRAQVRPLRREDVGGRTAMRLSIPARLRRTRAEWSLGAVEVDTGVRRRRSRASSTPRRSAVGTPRQHGRPTRETFPLREPPLADRWTRYAHHIENGLGEVSPCASASPNRSWRGASGMSRVRTRAESTPDHARKRSARSSLARAASSSVRPFAHAVFTWRGTRWDHVLVVVEDDEARDAAQTSPSTLAVASQCAIDRPAASCAWA